MRPLLAALLLPVLSTFIPAPAWGQEVKKEVLDHIRNVSVSIEWLHGDGTQKCHGSGTLFEHKDEFFCITCSHVVKAAEGKQIRVAQRHHDKRPISVNAEVVSQCEKTDVAILKVGQGVFGPGVKFYRDCCASEHGQTAAAGYADRSLRQHGGPAPYRDPGLPGRPGSRYGTVSR